MSQWGMLRCRPPCVCSFYPAHVVGYELKNCLIDQIIVFHVKKCVRRAQVLVASAGIRIRRLRGKRGLEGQKYKRLEVLLAAHADHRAKKPTGAARKTEVKRQKGRRQKLEGWKLCRQACGHAGIRASGHVGQLVFPAAALDSRRIGTHLIFV